MPDRPRKRVTVERRAHARYTRSVEIQGAAGTTEAAARMLASDLSLGGLYCSSAADFPEMTRLAVTLMIPENGTTAPLDLEAVVVRRKALRTKNGPPRYELALLFTSMPDDKRERLALYLARSPEVF